MSRGRPRKNGTLAIQRKTVLSVRVEPENLDNLAQLVNYYKEYKPQEIRSRANKGNTIEYLILKELQALKECGKDVEYTWPAEF
ncbi:hypothetical protein [Bacillus sp. mrc49]|uniref:hypothetical protein n=1 Tax=Bacillus sp. mrc49 TaxID=2054913 RepID=UPI000C270ABF|nr:hypothetical protein [Bacillus sp. mrc49]PJN90607.1 hypothetical protein CVN76_09425 [Bacillus sp. mrc49]